MTRLPTASARGVLLLLAGAAVACVLAAPAMAQAVETAASAAGADASSTEVAALAAAVAQVPSLACLALLVWRQEVSRANAEVSRAARDARFLETIERIVAGGGGK